MVLSVSDRGAVVWSLMCVVVLVSWKGTVPVVLSLTVIAVIDGVIPVDCVGGVT